MDTNYLWDTIWTGLASAVGVVLYGALLKLGTNSTEAGKSESPSGSREAQGTGSGENL